MNIGMDERWQYSCSRLDCIEIPFLCILERITLIDLEGNTYTQFRQPNLTPETLFRTHTFLNHQKRQGQGWRRKRESGGVQQASVSVTLCQKGQTTSPTRLEKFFRLILFLFSCLSKRALRPKLDSQEYHLQD